MNDKNLLIAETSRAASRARIAAVPERLTESSGRTSAARAVATLAVGLAAMIFTDGLAHAQQQPPLPQPFDNPGNPGDRIMQLQIPGNSAGRLPLQRPATPNPARLNATAGFEPTAISMKRFGEYRVTITGARHGVDLPEPLPAPEGLVISVAGRTFGAQFLANGKRVDTVTFRYSVTAVRSGTFVLPSFTANVSGVSVTVPAAQLIVREPQLGEELYQSARAVLDLAPGDYFVGQAISARLLLIDSSDEVAQAIANVTKPSGDFLFKGQLGARRDNFRWQGRTVSGLVMPVQLTPIKPGETDVSLQAIVFISRLTGPGGPGTMRPPGTMSGFTAQAMLDTPPVRVVVRPLPDAGRRRGFTGAIGQFELGRSQLSATEVQVGDPVTLTISISGEGNLEAVSPPPLDGGAAWESFTPTSEVDRDVLTGRGSKTFTYTLIAKTPDARAVPAIPFSYFDPQRKEYVDLTIPPVPIVVKGAPATKPPAGDSNTAPPAELEAALEKPKTNQPILTGLAEHPGSWRRGAAPVSAHRWFWLLQSLPALGLLGLFAWRRRVDFLAKHPEVLRRRRARAATRQHLRRARAAALQQDRDTFVASGLNAIREAAAPLDTAQAGSLVLEEVLAKLDEPARNGEPGRIVRQLFDFAHTAHYSGHQPEPNGVLDLLPQIERTVSTLERQQP